MKSGASLPTEMSLHAFESDGRPDVLGLMRDRSEHRHREPGRSAARQPPHSRDCDARQNEACRNKEDTMVTTGLIVRLEAQAGKEEEVAAFLRDALPLVQDEPDTIAWLAVRVGAASFAIVDVFPDEQGRQAHLDGPVAAALIEKADKLLGKPPEIERVDVLTAKLP